MLDAPCALSRSADDGSVQQGFVLHLGEPAVMSCVQRPAFGNFHRRAEHTSGTLNPKFH